MINHAPTRKQVGITFVGNIFTQDTCRGGIYSIPHTANPCRGGRFCPFRTSLKRNNTTRFPFLIGKDEHVGDRNVINHAPTRKQVGITLVGNIFTQDTCRGGIHSVPHTANPCRGGIYSVPHTANPCRGGIYSVPNTANLCRGGRFCSFCTSLKRNNNAVSLSKKPTALLYKRIGAIVLTPYYSLEKPHLV